MCLYVINITKLTKEESLTISLVFFGCFHQVDYDIGLPSLLDTVYVYIQAAVVIFAGQMFHDPVKICQICAVL